MVCRLSPLYLTTWPDRDVERNGTNAQRRDISGSWHGFGECRDVNI